MPKVQAVVALAVILMIPNGVQAAESAQKSAKQLCDACAAVDRTAKESIIHSSPEALVLDQSKTMQCIGFVQGFLDAWVLRVEVPITRLGLSAEERAQMIGEVSRILESPFCLSPQGLSTERAIEAFVGYCKLKPPDDPEISARMFLVLALTEAFPACSTG